MNTPADVRVGIHVCYPGKIVTFHRALEDIVTDGTFQRLERYVGHKLLLITIMITTDTTGKTRCCPLSHLTVVCKSRLEGTTGLWEETCVASSATTEGPFSQCLLFT